MYSSSLKGKNAWVTGSSRGIGRIVAEFLAECGANVAIHGRNATNLAQYGEGETLEAVAEEMAERFGVRIVPVCGNLGRECWSGFSRRSTSSTRKSGNWRWAFFPPFSVAKSAAAA